MKRKSNDDLTVSLRKQYKKRRQLFTIPIESNLERLAKWNPSTKHCGSNCVSEVMTILYLQEPGGFARDYEHCRIHKAGFKLEDIQSYLNYIIRDKNPLLIRDTGTNILETALSRIPPNHISPILCEREGLTGHAMLLAHRLNDGIDTLLLIDQSTPELVDCASAEQPRVIEGSEEILKYMAENRFIDNCVMITVDYIDYIDEMSSKKLKTAEIDKSMAGISDFKSFEFKAPSQFNVGTDSPGTTKRKTTRNIPRKMYSGKKKTLKMHSGKKKTLKKM